MTKFKIGDKFIPRKPKGQEYPLMGKYWDKIFTVKSIENGWIRSVESGSRFRPDWCEKVEEHTVATSKTIDWEQRRYELVKEFMAAQIANSSLVRTFGEDAMEHIMEKAIISADELIKQLQESPKN